MIERLFRFFRAFSDSKGNNRQRKLGKGRGKQDTSSKGLNIH